MSSDSRLAVNRPPSGLTKNLPNIREVTNSDQVILMMAAGHLQPGTRSFRMGKASILLSPPTDAVGWHLSISRPDRYPSWDEVVAAWYSLVPNAQERMGVMPLPPLVDYINLAERCFQVHEIVTYAPQPSR